MKKKILFIPCIILLLSLFVGCQPTNKPTLKILNWGEYIDTDVIHEFETLYNVNIIYDTFDSNEAMYNRIASGAVTYDLLFPSDYMVEKMIRDDLLEPLDFTQLPNFSHINPDVLHRDFDPEQKYSLPYFWGTVGIVYDTTQVKEPVDSWDILWNQTYANNIFMYNSARDALMVAFKKLGYSMNTHNLAEIEQAKQALLAQKPLILGYVGDEVINAMINEQAYLAVVYSGDATAIIEANPKMAYAIPKTEGTNMWIDASVIPKNATEKRLAHQFMNYLADPEIAKLNTEEVGYSTPNLQTLELLAEEESPWIDWQSYNPTLSHYQNIEFFHSPDETFLTIYNDAWEEVLNA